MADRVGQRIGNYRLVRLLGEGSFAEVYLGEHLHLGTEAAVKVLTARLVGGEVGRFCEEAKMIARLKHAHIVRVLDFDVEEDTPFLVMDYAPGGTLRQRYPKGTCLAPLDILPYMQQISSALQYAHDHRLIHRDIKPENILVGESGEILVSDFGIAVLLEKAKTHITMDVFAGSPAYAAPEQFQNKPRPASDQYALGVLAYEWLSGERPFQGLAIAIGTQKALYPPPPLRVKVPTLSPAVEQVVMTALAADPKARFASVRAFATAFEQACQPAHDQLQTRPQPPEQVGALISFAPTQRLSPLADAQPAPAPALSPAPSIARPQFPVFSPPAVLASLTKLAVPRRRLSRRTVLIAGGLAGVAIAGGGGFWLAHTLFPPVGTLLYTYRGHTAAVTTVAWSPDGRRIISGAADDTAQAWDATDGGNGFIYRGHTATVDAVGWSSDGSRIASGSYDNTVQVWTATDGGNALVYQGHSSYVTAVAWSPNGERIASGGFDNTVQVWDASSGGVAFIYIYRGHTNGVLALAWSPDGRRIASGGYDNTVQVWDAAFGGNAFIYRGHAGSVTAMVWSPDGKRIASGSDDKTVQIWDASKGSHIFTYRGHAASVKAVGWSPKYGLIASGSDDNTVQVWQAE